MTSCQRTASLFVLLLTTQIACGQSERERVQIAEATAALPPEFREGATVMGYRDGSTELIKLRQGTNGMLCLADKPGDESFHVACYHESLEPFMARGRALRSDSLDRQEIARIRRDEIEDGTLAFPDHPATLYSRTDGTLNPETGEIDDSRGLQVIYISYATPEETGLTTDPSRGGPWLMFPGEPWAHVMISRD